MAVLSEIMLLLSMIEDVEYLFEENREIERICFDWSEMELHLNSYILK